MTYKPTDAELDALRQADNGDLNFVTLRQFRIIARAALAKWGSPVVAGPDDDINAMGLARYKVVPAHESMFHRFAVVAGDGQQQLYLGRETECQNMARKFAGAFLDGAFYHSRATQPTQAQEQAGAVPLTAEQAQDLIDLESWGPEAISLNAQLLRTIRRTETAHGIGETP